MFRKSPVTSSRVISVLMSVALILGVVSPSLAADKSRVQRVVVPEADRFVPFALTIRVGDTVEWVNRDTDDHTIVSDNFFTTTDNKGTNLLLIGTVNNGGKPGIVRLRFTHPGTFVYYCRFHSHLDDAHQPVAPGPDGGIQDANGNFGTPMSGIITVVPGDD